MIGREYLHHSTVLQHEIVSLLEHTTSVKVCVDATLGDGGHTCALLEADPGMRVIAIERDQMMLGRAQERLTKYGERIEYINEWFDEYFANQGQAVHPQFILFDLGIAHPHYQESGRGFSFLQADEPLDMRLNDSNTVSAEVIVNRASEKNIEEVLRVYGEERFARRIASAIVRQRKQKAIKTVGELTSIILKTLPQQYRRGRRTHPATRSFMALRMAVNCELDRLGRALPLAFSSLEDNGLLAVISFHSGEDRLVKYFMRHVAAEECATVLYKKPVTAGEQESADNRSARSAKLRAIIKQKESTVAWEQPTVGVEVLN